MEIHKKIKEKASELKTEFGDKATSVVDMILMETSVDFQVWYWEEVKKKL